TDLTNEIGDVESQLKIQEDPSELLERALAGLRTANSNRSNRTQEWVQEIQRLSNGKIKATVVADGDISEIREAVDIIAAKTGSQETARTNRLEEALSNDTAANIVDQLLKDCLDLLRWRLLGAA